MLPIELWAQLSDLSLPRPLSSRTENLVGTYALCSSPKISGDTNLLHFSCHLFARPSLPPGSRSLVSTRFNQQTHRVDLAPKKNQIKRCGTTVLCFRTEGDFTEISQRFHRGNARIQPGDMTPACSQLQGRWPTHTRGSESKQLRSRAEHRISRAPQMGSLEPSGSSGSSGLVPIQFEWRSPHISATGASKKKESKKMF